MIISPRFPIFWSAYSAQLIFWRKGVSRIEGNVEKKVIVFQLPIFSFSDFEVGSLLFLFWNTCNIVSFFTSHPGTPKYPTSPSRSCRSFIKKQLKTPNPTYRRRIQPRGRRKEKNKKKRKKQSNSQPTDQSF